MNIFSSKGTDSPNKSKGQFLNISAQTHLQESQIHVPKPYSIATVFFAGEGEELPLN